MATWRERQSGGSRTARSVGGGLPHDPCTFGGRHHCNDRSIDVSSFNGGPPSVLIDLLPDSCASQLPTWWAAVAGAQVEPARRDGGPLSAALCHHRNPRSIPLVG